MLAWRGLSDSKTKMSRVQKERKARGSSLGTTRESSRSNDAGRSLCPARRELRGSV